MSNLNLRVVDPAVEHSRDIARRRVHAYRQRRKRWIITPEEFARVQAATVREQKVNRALVAESNRRKRWADIASEL